MRSGNISEARSGCRITYGHVEFGAAHEVGMMLRLGSLRGSGSGGSDQVDELSVAAKPPT